MLLVCNAPQAVGELLERRKPTPDPQRSRRIERLIPRLACVERAALPTDAAYQGGLQSIAKLSDE